LEEAVRSFTGERVRVECASRTDAGVHAEGQVASVRTAAQHDPATWVKAMNHFLPEDVGVREAYVIPGRYSVRSQATGRRYRYLILNRQARSALLRTRTHWVPRLLDLDAMNGAAHTLLGERDFAPFASATMKRASTTRKLRAAAFRRDGDIVGFEVEGNAFLPQQVRRMAGALVQVGLGKSTIAQFRAKAESGVLGSAGPTLPPQGLTLVEVTYRVPLSRVMETEDGRAGRERASLAMRQA
jgi:tRNA pseudouridine38-40 synthase